MLLNKPQPHQKTDSSHPAASAKLSCKSHPIKIRHFTFIYCLTHLQATISQSRVPDNKYSFVFVQNIIGVIILNCFNPFLKGISTLTHLESYCRDKNQNNYTHQFFFNSLSTFYKTFFFFFFFYNFNYRANKMHMKQLNKFLRIFLILFFVGLFVYQTMVAICKQF